MEMNAVDPIGTEPQPTCVVCGSSGTMKYRDVPDRLFGAPGRWNVKECDGAGCGTLWLDPRPTLADVGKAYRNYYTHGDGAQRSLIKRTVRVLAREHAATKYGFSSSRFPWPGKYLASAAATLYPGLRDNLELMIRYLPAAALNAGKLLDIGCGDGEALEFLGDLGWQASGVEVDPKAAEAARRFGLDVRQGTLFDASFDAQSFDAVTSSHVIEHVHDPKALLVESRRILRSGGTLVAITPNANAWMHKQHGVDWLNLDPPRHLALFTAESLRRLALQAGFRDVQVTTTARAVALTEIASSAQRDQGHYAWGKWPGLTVWLRAQAKQALEPILMAFDRVEGDELVLIARE